MQDHASDERGITPLVCSVAEAERLLGCAHDTIYQLIHAHKLRSFLIGRRRKILMSSVEQYVAECAAAAAANGFEKAVFPPPVPPSGQKNHTSRRSRGR